MSTSLIQGKRFYCREWIFSKLWHSLESLQHRPEEDGANTHGRNGILIIGGAGAGKTALCSEIVSPSVAQGKQRSLKKRLLAHHFCQAHDADTLSLTNFVSHIAGQLAKSGLIAGYLEKVGEENLRSALENASASDIDSLFKKLVIFPLMEIEKPKTCSFILIDSIDETIISPNQSHSSCSSSGGGGGAGTSNGTSKSIGELLGNHAHLFPPWLILICTARKQSKPVAKMFSGFRKIGLDDLRKSQVVRDVQQYILSRLDQDYSLRQHISRETAEMLNQLHIKSNGCFLYLEKVLDGISENFIVLREIREIPGTLYGLYLWLCQRLFTKKQFSRVQLILSLLLASPKPLKDEDIFNLIRLKNSLLTKEDFSKRMHILRRVLIKSSEGHRILFHHSFAEWLIDVKYCTQKYLCQTGEGHSCFVAAFAADAPQISQSGISELAYHIVRTPKTTLDPSLQHIFLLTTGLSLVNTKLPPNLSDPKVMKLFDACGVIQIEPEPVSESEKSDKPPATSSASPPKTGVQNGVEPEEHEEEEELDLVAAAEASLLEKLANDEQDEVPNSLVDLLDDINQLYCNQRTLLHNACNEGNLELVEILISKGASLEIPDKHGRTPLNLASRQGHESIVEALLEAGAQFDHCDKDGWSPLRSAAWAGHTGVVDALLAKGAEVDLTDGEGRTALRAAAWGGHEEVVVSLLRAGASPSLADNEGRTSLIAAAYMGHAEIVERLLNAGGDVNHCDSDGRSALSVATLLCAAASQNHIRVVTLLLERNSNVNHQDKDDTSPLLCAAFEGHREVCELLLEYEADVDLADKAGRTPLWAAASMGHAAVCELLLFWGAYIDHIDGEGRTVLSVACAQGNVNVVRLLLARGLDEGHRDNSGWSPILYASFEGHQEVCETLLEAGARVNDSDNDGKFPLLLAAQEGHLNVVECLINYGGYIDQKSHDGKTALRAAALEGYKDIVQYLVNRGSDVNYRDADNRTTLYLLALDNRVAMAQFLIRLGADVEARDLEGRSSLHVSAWQGHLEMVELLMSAGAQVNAQDNDRRSPLQSASWQGHTNIVRLLCDRGAKIDHTCNQGATALCIAAQEGHLECVKILLDWGANPFHEDRYGRTPLKVSIKSGHAEITQLITMSHSKMMQGTNAWNENNKPSNSNYPSSTTPVGYYDALPVSPLTSPLSTLDAEKRRSLSSMNPPIFNSSGKSPNLSEMPYHEIKISPHERLKMSGVGVGSKGMRSGGGGGSLSFTQQVEQVSRGKGHRPKSKMMSPLGSPIYASPPQSPGENEELSRNPYSNIVNQGSAHSSGHLKGLLFNGNSSFDSQSKGNSSRPNSNLDSHSFAFHNRDSHMKIILGSSEGGNKSKKNGLVNIGNGGGKSTASSVIRSGLNAIKAGVLEAAVGKKFHNNDSPLISAATQEPRSMLLLERDVSQ